jgi:hypothetical protein
LHGQVLEEASSTVKDVVTSILFSGEFSPIPYLILELATNTLGIFSKKLDEIAKSTSEKY